MAEPVRTKVVLEPVPLPRTATIVALLRSAYAELEEMARKNQNDGWRIYGINAILRKHSYHEVALDDDQARIVIYYLKALGLIRNVGVKVTDGEWWVRPRGRLSATAAVSSAAVEQLVDDGKVPSRPVTPPAPTMVAVAG
jgi:hypothetical protein